MPGTPIKVLAVDDDEFMRIFLKDVFWLHNNSNDKFDVVSNLKKAKEFVKDEKSKPNLIFLDLRLPEEDGQTPDMENSFRFLSELKKNPATKNIKVIIFSSFGDKEIQDRSLKLGADKFMVKGEYLPQEIMEIAGKIVRGEQISTQ